MAYTASPVASGPNGARQTVLGAQRETVTDFVITAMAAGGEPVQVADLGLNTVDSAFAQVQSAVGASTGVEAVVVAPLTAPKIKVNLATGADAAVGTSTTVRVVARGK